MKIDTIRATTYYLTLTPEEWFTLRIADDRVVSVDRIEAGQAEEGGRWDVVLHGNRVLKSGAFGKRARVATWEHTRSFSDTGRTALWVALPATVQYTLSELGVKV